MNSGRCTRTSFPLFERMKSVREKPGFVNTAVRVWHSERESTTGGLTADAICGQFVNLW
jgi:hypothetical protein